MSSGRDHTAATFGLACIYSTVDWKVGIWILTGILLSPDLDVDGGYIGYKFLRPFPPLYWLWRAWWYPYSKFIPHRSWISHMPFVSTGLRILYLLGPLFCVYYYFTSSWLIVPWDFVHGLVLSDFLHAVMDFYNPDGSGYTRIPYKKTFRLELVKPVSNRRGSPITRQRDKFTD